MLVIWFYADLPFTQDSCGFGVNDLADDSLTIYRSLEHEGKKGANELTCHEYITR